MNSTQRNQILKSSLIRLYDSTAVAPPRRPRAIALVLGHLGVTSQQLESYATLYQQRGCAVVTAASPQFRFLRNASMQPVAQILLEETQALLVKHQKDTNENVSSNDGSNAVVGESNQQHQLPVVIHLFSNGGCFLLEEIQEILKEKDGQFDSVRKSLATGYQFFDSCPCFIRTVTTSTGWTRAFPFEGWSVPARTAYTVAASVSLTLWCTVTLAWSRPHAFWTRMQQQRVCHHQVYAYTTADAASDATAVDDLIAYRSEQYKDQETCHILRYTDSGHCQLLRDHRNDYLQAIDKALEEAIERSKSL